MRPQKLDFSEKVQLLAAMRPQKLDFSEKVQLLAATIALAILAHATPASAHGGGIPQLVQTPSGPYHLYAWTNPNPARAGVVHITVALAEPASQQPVLNAAVQVVAAPGGGGQPVSVPATHQNAVIKTYYEADLTLPTAGLWQFTVSHSDAAGSGSASFVLDVQPAGRNWRPFGIGGVLAVIAVGAWFVLKKQ